MARAARKERREIIAWEPQPGPQDDFIAAKWCPECFYGGAVGGGKSDALLGDFLQDVFVYGDAWKGVIFRRTYPELEKLIERAKQIYTTTGATWHEQKKTFIWQNGAFCKFRHLKRVADAENYQGHEYTWIGFDELTHWPNDKAYRILLARLRSADPSVRNLRIRSTGNPGGPGHNWVKSRFIDPAPLGYQVIVDFETGQERMFIPARVSDNPLLLKATPDYIDRLKGIGSPELVRAFLFGDWNQIVGAYFKFEPERHVIHPFALPPAAQWTRISGFDWGSARPFAMVWGAVANGEGEGEAGRIPRGAIVIYREAYGGKNNEGWRWHAEQTADYLLALEGGDKPQIRRADTQIWEQDGGPPIAERMARRGLVFTKADKKRVAGWDQIRARLEGEDGKPMLYIFSTCRELIRTLPTLQHDELKPEDIDTEGDDHCADALRYLCMSRPYTAPKKAPPPDLTRKPTINELWAIKERENAWTK